MQTVLFGRGYPRHLFFVHKKTIHLRSDAEADVKRSSAKIVGSQITACFTNIFFLFFWPEGAGEKTFEKTLLKKDFLKKLLNSFYLLFAKNEK